MQNFHYLILVIVGIVAVGIMPAEKNKLKIFIALLIGIFSIAYVVDSFTAHYGAISPETVKNGLPLFAAFAGYAGTAIIYVLYASKQQTSSVLGGVLLITITGSIMSLALFFVTNLLLTGS